VIVDWKVFKMRVTACPFCGVPTDVPHERQELCIEALQHEVARMREMVRRVKDPPREHEPRTEEPPARDPV
jgi:hypothetical protein